MKGVRIVSRSPGTKSTISYVYAIRRPRKCATNAMRGAEINASRVAHVAICGYIVNMASIGIRRLKDNLSRYIRRIEAGERIAITAHGRVVAELVPPGAASRAGGRSRFDELVAAGVIRPPIEGGD